MNIKAASEKLRSVFGMEHAAWILLTGVVVWLRFSGLRWGSGLLTHPDETRIAMGIQHLLSHSGDPGFSAYGHLPLYLQAALLKVLAAFRWLSTDAFPDIIMAGRIVAAALSLGTIILSARLARLMNLPPWAALLTAFGTAFFPLSVQLSAFSTVDAHTSFFTLLALERALTARQRGRLHDFILTGAALGAALACKASAFPLLLVIWIPIARYVRTLRFWSVFIGALLFFAVFQPYAWLNHTGFFRDVLEQMRWVRGSHPPIFFAQYEGARPFFYALRDLFFFSVGVTGIPLALVGFFASLRNRTGWVLAVWFAVQALILSTSFAKFARYWLPLMPLFALYAAWGVVELRSAARRIHAPKLRRVLGVGSMVAAAIHVIQTASAGLAMHQVHRSAHPNVPAAEVVSRLESAGPDINVLYDSVWSGFPVLPHRLSERTVRFEYADVLRPHASPEFAQRLSAKLHASDVFVTINHLALRSAFEHGRPGSLAAKFFEAMRRESLGYSLESVVTLPRRIWGLTFPGFLLDYSITYYDHPTIFIWSNRERKPAREIASEIMRTDVVFPERSLLDYKCKAEPSLACRAAFSPPPEPKYDHEKAEKDLEPHRGQPILWYLFFLLTGLAAWPLSMRLFKGGIGAGYGCARVLGWVIVGFVLWWLGHLPIEPLTDPVIRALWLTALAAGAASWLHKGFRTVLRGSRVLRQVLLIESTALAVFLLFLLFRTLAPDIYWSENPVDLSYLSSLLKVRQLPPPDPGYAGTSLNYYYYGHFLMAWPARALGLPPNVAYGLAMCIIPSLASGLLLTGGASLGRSRPRLIAGFFSVVLVILAGNWDGIVQYAEFLFDGSRQLFRFDFFQSAHSVIPHTVHEFPLWSFLFVDLHAHVISGVLFLQFLVWMLFADLRGMTRTSLILGAVLLGAMGPASTWDYFTSCVLTFLVGAFALMHRRDATAALRALALIVISYLAHLPFYAVFTKEATDLGVGWVGSAVTPLGAAVICMGLFLTLLLADMTGLARRILTRGSAVVPVSIAAFVSVAAVGILIAFRTLPYAMLLYGLSGLAVMTLALRRGGSARTMNPNLLAALAVVMLVACEVFFIRDFLQGGEWKRMNTVFKFYYQAWYLLALSAPFLLARALSARRGRNTRRVAAVVVGAAILVSLAWTPGGIDARARLHAFQRAGRFERTLNGLDWLKHLRPGEYAAVAWLWRNGGPDDVLIEAGHGDYRYEYNVVSGASGVQSVQGWWSHTSQRDRPYEKRVPYVKEAYETPDIERTAEILRGFGVTYVYVGERERIEYGEHVTAKFAAHPDRFEPMVSFPDSTLYRFLDR